MLWSERKAAGPRWVGLRPISRLVTAEKQSHPGTPVPKQLQGEPQLSGYSLEIPLRTSSPRGPELDSQPVVGS